SDVANLTGNPAAVDQTTNYTVPTIAYPPNGFQTAAANGDELVLEADGVVDVVDPTNTGQFTLGVLGDDSYELLVNGQVVLQQDTPGGPAVATNLSAPITLTDGDQIQLFYVRTDAANSALSLYAVDPANPANLPLVGDPASGILITHAATPTPTPTP